ncbi:MAG TPA: acyltransferase family protein [Acidimicrobiia bacterium]
MQAVESATARAGSDAGSGHQRHLVRMRYMPGIDGLRAVAVMGVLFYHAGEPWMRGGFLGVDVFFVISGYLITSLLLAEFRNKGRMGLGQFYLRRARRLLPALFFLLAVVSLFVIVFLPNEITKMRGDVVAALTYTTNWYQIFHHQSYFEAVGRPPMLRHLWSLAVEEQFYLIWPLMLMGMLRLSRGRHRPVMIATIGLAAVSTVLMILLASVWHMPIPADPTRVYFGTDTRISTMLIGAALAMFWAPWRLSEQVEPGGKALLNGVGLGSLALVIWMFVGLHDTSGFLYRGGGFAAVALATAVLIAMTVHPAASLSSWFLGRQPFRYLGERSYGIYLWHWPIYQITRPVLDVSLTGWANLTLRFAMTLGMAELSYRFVEQPIRHGALGRWFARMREASGAEWGTMARRTLATIGGGALLVVLVFVGLATARPAPPPPGIDTSASAGQLIGSSPAPSTPAQTPGLTPRTTPATRAPTRPGAPPTAPPLPPGVPPVTAVGDSVMLGAQPAITAAIPGAYVNAQVSRFTDGVIDVIRQLRAQGTLAPVVVLHVGTNGSVTDGQMQQLLSLLGDRRKVVFINLKVPRSWEASDNGVIANWVHRFPHGQLIDWHDLGAAHPDYFYEDGIHLRPPGARYYASLIQQAVTTP